MAFDLGVSNYRGNKTVGTLRCLVRLHPWTVWSDPKMTEVYSGYDPRPIAQQLPIYMKYTQARVCQHCRKVQTRSWTNK